MDWCVTLIVVGGLAEIAGFGLAIYEMGLIQRREFPDYRPVHHRALTWVRRKLGLAKSQTIQVGGAAAVSAAGSVSVEGTRGPAPEDDLKARIERLENITDDLRRRQQHVQAAVEERIAKHEQQTRDAETALRTELTRLEEERRATLRESIAYEKVAIGLFVVGVVLSTLGSTVAC